MATELSNVKRIVVALCAPCLLVCASASAQEGESALGQGQANINVRSDVTLGIKGLRATTTERLAKLTEVVSDQLPGLRTCYRGLVAKRPTTVGSIEIRVTLDPDQPKPGLELDEKGGSDGELTGCVKRVFEKAPLQKLERPAAALVTLQFENTRAKGEQEMAERRRVSDAIDVHERAGGGFEASWTANDGHVGFSVSGTSKDGVEASMRVLRESFALFADCRRRSEKGGLSPTGALAAKIQIAAAGAKSSAKVSSSTVASPRAPQCVEHAFRTLKADGKAGLPHVDVSVTFGP